MSVLLIILSILLTVVVLMQPGKGDISSSFGGLTGQFSSILGTRRAADFLTKLTIGLSATILLLALVTNLFFVGGQAEVVKPVTEGVEIPATPAVPNQTPALPIQPAPQKTK